MTTCILTDPSAVLPRAWLDDLPVRIVPLEIAWPDGSVEAGDLPYSAIADRLATSPAPPTTGAPSPGTFASLIGELLATHEGVLVVCPSSELSTTFQSATLGARELGDDRVRVIDSKTAAAGQGLAVCEAARTALIGASLDDVCERAVAVASRASVWATLSQLAYLRRSGRIPALAAFGAEALGIHPVVRYAGSSPTVAGVARSPARAVDRLYRAWERTACRAPLSIVAFHSGRSADADSLLGRIVASVPQATSVAVEVPASLASHTGPGLLGLAWFWDN